jgi:hypothetical protein
MWKGDETGSGALTGKGGYGVMGKQRAIVYALLILLAVTVRAVYVVHDRSFLETGSKAEVERVASDVAHAGELGNAYSDTSGKTAHVSPLYPLFLGGLYWAFGLDTVASRTAQGVCSIIATTSAFVMLPTIAAIAGLSTVAGWGAAFVLALLPINLWVETSGSWEAPYSALLLLGLLAIFCRMRDHGWLVDRLAFGTGALTGITALCAPSLLPAIALMILVEFLLPRPPGTRRRVLLGSMIIVAVAGLILAPWVARNYIAFGGFVPFRSNFGLELYIGNNPAANGTTFVTAWDDPNSPVLSMHPFSSAAQRAHLRDVGELAYMSEKRSAAIQWMCASPREALALIARRFRLFWFPPSRLWVSSSRGRGLKAASFSLIALLALLELARLARARHDRAWLLAAAVSGPSIVYLLTHVDPRYRYPVFALTTLLALDFVLSLGRGLALRKPFSALRLGATTPDQ